MNNNGDIIRTPSRLSYVEDVVLWQQDTDIDKATEALHRDLTLLKRFVSTGRCRSTQAKLHDTFSFSNPVLKDLNIRIRRESLRRDISF
ncbi:hypothetical protein PoB_005036500 [Plakobranchus ocellatus]|uniref:Reverse transcriptase domain-containing protein n=1 Tax=Plakobranchus ocellatus TaxID=259542 RepID=A0AAV4BTT6_9GAST|nr:hypothetical protein PoB_005036500 [Plakobranchus ocellatus]